MVDAIVVYSLVAGLAVILLLGALDKWRNLAAFEQAVSGYQLLPPALVKPFAMLFVTAESFAALALLLPAWRVFGATLTLAVLLAASGGVAVNLARGLRNVDCGCGGLGHSAQGLSGWLLLRNAFLVLAAVLVWLGVPADARSLMWLDVVTFFGATLALLGLYFTANVLIDFEIHLYAQRQQSKETL